MTSLAAQTDTWFNERRLPRTGILNATLLGTGSSLPERVIENDYFPTVLGLDTTAEWIVERTGISQRRWAGDDERTSDLATAAAEAALRQADLPASRVGLIIVATSTPDYTMPSTACLVQQRLGATRAMAFDVQNACAAFVYALDVALRMLQTNLDVALVIGVDLGSRLVDRNDRSTCIFFGDGAGAVVAGSWGPGRVLASQMHARGDAASLSMPVGGAIRMQGRAIWDFATDVLPATVRGLCQQAETPLDKVRMLVPHQANRNMLLHAAAQLELPVERLAINVERYGNTLAASIPLALDEACRDGRVRPGDHVQLVGFGAGLAWGGIHWQL